MIDNSLNERSMKGQSAPCGHILGDLAICSECVAVGSCTSGSPYMLDRVCAGDEPRSKLGKRARE